MADGGRATVYHIPVCPFSQRVEILLALKGRRADVTFTVIDITKPRPDWLLRRTRGTTALPVLETADGRIIKESMVILRYLEDVFPDPPVAQRDPYRHAVEGMLNAMEGPFVAAGYRFVMNQDPDRRTALRDEVLAHYAKLNGFLAEHNPDGVWLFEDFGLCEAVYAPIFMRFWFLEHYEGFALPDGPEFARVRRWQDACRAHPAAQQVTRDEIVTLYYDYAKGAGNGALPPGRTRSSFAFEPHWSQRPLPPRDKYGHAATDRDLGLVE
jgi:glutathione S-transferase